MLTVRLADGLPAIRACHTFPNSRSDAIRAPSLKAASFAQTISAATRPAPARGVEAAIGAALHPARVADDFGHALQALGDRLRMLDDVGQRIDHAGHDDLIVRAAEWSAGNV